jgi:hypothetical protein
MTCDWGDCGRGAVGWRFWPGAGNPWDHAKGGWRNPPWRPVCDRHLPRRPREWGLAS